MAIFLGLVVSLGDIFFGTTQYTMSKLYMVVLIILHY